ncbi:MAG: hypothetical protein U1F06_09355 [Steroidobacteraceae bacterium]
MRTTDVAGGQHVGWVGVHAEREHGVVLEQPDLVGRVGRSVNACIERRVGSGARA